MAIEQVIPVSQLLLDTQNPRFPGEQPTQRNAIQMMARIQGERIVALAQHIVEHGFNPASLTIVMISDAEDDMYEVLDGNRRLTALKLLENPSLGDGVFSGATLVRLKQLSIRFGDNPVLKLRCVVVADRDEANTWIPLLHRGYQGGAGLVEWDGQVAARYDSRKGLKSEALQVLDYIEEKAQLSADTRGRIHEGKFPITTLNRLIHTPHIRQKIGIDRNNGIIVTSYPEQEVIKGLTRIVEDLGSGTLTVSRLKNQQQRIDYINRLTKEELPDPRKVLPKVYPLDLAPSSVSDDSASPSDQSNTSSANSTTGSATETEASNSASATGAGATENQSDTNGGTSPAETSEPNRSNSKADSGSTTNSEASSKKKKYIPRVNLIPPNCKLPLPHHRLNSMFKELKALPLAHFQNSGAVMLRVFIELTVDYFLEHKVQWPDQQIQGSSLAQKISSVASYLETNNIMTADELTPIKKAVSGQTLIVATVRSMNSYIHSRHYSPIPSELITVWDDFQPFIEKVWQTL
jgi:hypothetical protein